MSYGPAAGSRAGLGDIDESTRLLRIGALVDREFADAAVREFLTEPRRAVPPSPGVDPLPVLRECLAARRRRRIRDLLLGLLMVLFLCIDGGVFFLAWLFVAIVWRFVGPQRRRLDRAWRAETGTTRLVRIAIGGLVGIFALASSMVFTAVLFFTRFAGPLAASSPYQAPGEQPSAVPGLMLATFAIFVLLACSLGMLTILWVDRLAVWRAITGRLRRQHYTAEPPSVSSRLDSTLWSPGNGMHARNLETLVTDHVNCVVYRGSRPFVGSGNIVEPWSIAIALEPAQQNRPLFTDAGDGPENGSHRGDRALSIIGVHEEVTRQLGLLRGDSSLSPSRRLTRMRNEGLVFVPARSLAQHADEPDAGLVFRDQRHRLTYQLSGADLQRLARDPHEWMRYFAAYVVESWDREVTVSVLMHYGLDERNLYVECVPCVLPPVAPQYRRADSLSDRSSSYAFLDALGSWTVLPLTIVPRVVAALRPLDDAYAGSHDPERLGAVASLREIAASADLDDYAQASDANRYLQLLQTRIVRAIGAHLEDCGLSAVDFMRKAEALTINGNGNTVVGRADNSMFGGQGNAMHTRYGGGYRAGRPGTADSRTADSRTADSRIGDSRREAG